MTDFTIPGTAYYAACDPRTSSVPTEEGWPDPSIQKVGKGIRCSYPVEWADAVASHMQEVGEGLMYGEPEDRAEGRLLQKAAQSVRDQVSAVSHG